MSLFQCGNCGAAENTALSGQGCCGYMEQFFDWTGIEDRKGNKLCSECAPTKYSDGTPTEYGKWHGRFPKVLLPMGQFVTNREGNLAHKDSGDIEYRKYAVSSPTSTTNAKE